MTATRLSSLVFVFAMSFAPAACDNPGPPGAPADTATGKTRTLLTDAPFPFDRVARVDLYVVSISGSVSPDTSAANANFLTMATPRRRINVLALQGGLTEELGTASLPTGVITALRMVIDTDSSSITLEDGRVLTGKSTPSIQWQSSAGRPTLNALIHDQIDVPSTGGVAVVDFDVGQAFLPTQDINPASTDSGFIFSPYIRAVDGTRTGTISGTVRAKSASGAPVADASLRLYFGKSSQPENTWAVFGTARTDASGSFKFAYVTRSAWMASRGALAGGTYIVAVDPPSGSALGRALAKDFIVTSGQDTPTGTIVVP
jgi:hypothetical protein